MTSTKTLSLALLAGAATIVSMQPAMALDAQAFVDRIAAVYGTAGYDLQFGKAKLSGDSVIVDGITVGIKGMGDVSLPLDSELTFSGITELADGGYMAKSLTIADIEAEIEADVPGHISLRDIMLEDFYLPGGDNVGFQALLQMYGTFHTGPLSVTRDGKEVVSIASMEAGNTFNPAQGSAALVDVASSLAINDLMVDLSEVKNEDPEAGAAIEGLGLTTITGNISQSMTWTMADGRITMDQFLLDFDELGSLDILLDVVGFTPAVMDQIYAAQAAMLEEGTDPASEEAMNAQMAMGMQLAQSISIASASVRYDDASLAGKLLDFLAQAQAIERAQFVEGLKVMLPEMLAGTGVPALAELITGPVSTFLDEPQSLEVAVAPASPTSLLVLTGAAVNPAGLIDLLGLSFTANQAAQ